MLKQVAVVFVCASILPLLLKLIVKLRLLPLTVYTLLAGTLFVQWSESHQFLSTAIFVFLAVLTVFSWIMPLIRSIAENRQLERDFQRDMCYVRERGIDPRFLNVNGKLVLQTEDE